MNNGWIKMYRKAQFNDIWKDQNAWRVFEWLLMNVDYKTGTGTFGRRQIAEGTGLNYSTIYKVTTRLQTKYQVLSKQSNNHFTKFRLLNWAKYQHDEGMETGNVDEIGQLLSKQSNTNKEVKNIRIKNIYDVSKKRPLVKEIKPYERKPQEKQSQLERIVYHLEDKIQTRITLWPKQAKALSQMLRAGYGEKEIIKAIDYMAEKDNFYEDKGFDLMTVAKQIPYYKAMDRKRSQYAD